MPYKDPSKRREYNNKKVKEWRKTPAGKLSVQKSREKGKAKAKSWSQQYYLKNKSRILKRTVEYRNRNREKLNREKRENGYNVNRGQKDRLALKDSYVVAQIKKEGSSKSVSQKKKEILLYRIKKSISKTLTPSEKSRNYRATEAGKISMNKYKIKNAEKIKQSQKKYYQKNKEKRLASSKKYYAKHKKRLLLMDNARRQKKKK